MSQTETALALPVTLQEAVAEYNAAMGLIRRAFEMVQEAEAKLQRTFAAGSPKDYYLEVRARAGRQIHWGAPDEVLKEVNAQVWRVLVDRTEVRNQLSTRAAKELDQAIKTHQMPPISVQAVQDLANSFVAQHDALLADAVTEVYARLRPPGSKYKRNSEMEVPERVVLSFMVEPNWDNTLHPSFSAMQELANLERVFTSLDGKGSIPRVTGGELYQALVEAGRAGSPEASTHYFQAKMFRNGNLHLKFLRLDLLAKFNQIAGGNRLRPAPEDA